mgnify:FL=1
MRRGLRGFHGFSLPNPRIPRNPRLKEVSRGFCPSLRIVTLLLDTQQFHFEYQSRERFDLATGFS